MSKKLENFTPTHIVVVESGWVFAAVFDPERAGLEAGAPYEHGGNFSAKHAAVIREWGTTNGLGQLALSGVTGNTKLDRCSIIHIPADKILYVMENTATGWEKAFTD